MTGTVNTAALIHALAADGWQLRERGVDDLLVGPAGAYLVAIRLVPGRAAIEEGTLVARVDDEDEMTVRYGGLRGRLLAASARFSARPVVVIWGDFPDRAVDDDGVAYVHGDELAAWLRSRSRAVQLAS